MALNPFFLQGSPSEQRLVQSLINEHLQMHGVEVIYIPRNFVNKKTIIEEVQASRFDDNYAIEAYVNTYEGYAGGGDILTKFGMSLRDEVTLTISKERDGSVLNQVRVPLAYGPKQKFLARLDQETGFDAPMAIKLPRMAFEMTSLTIDTTQKMPKRNKIVELHASDVTKKKTIKHWTSYDIGMSLYIMAKNQDDGLQIVEQILPYFTPEYNVTITPVDGFTHKQDVAVILGGVNIDDQYEGDFTERRVLIYQLDFVMKMKFYGPTGDQGVIREINIDFKDKGNVSDIMEQMDITINPTTADEDDNYTVVTTIKDGDE